MRDNKILCRQIKPAGRKLGLSFVNWQLLANLSCRLGYLGRANRKDVQAMMGHARISTLLDVYAQFVSESLPGSGARRHRDVRSDSRLVRRQYSESEPNGTYEESK